MRPFIILVTLLLLSWHVLGGKPKGDEEDGGDSEDSGNEGDDDDDDEEVVSSGTNTKPCNTACILVFQPVCAINSRLVVKTFSNSCILGVFNCQNKEDFVAVANCSCINDGIAITPSKEKEKNEEEEGGEEDD